MKKKHKAEDHIEREGLRQKHRELHRAFDELLACYLRQTRRLPSEITAMELVEWSYKMTEEPTCAK